MVTGRWSASRVPGLWGVIATILVMTLGCSSAASGCDADLSGKHTSVIAVQASTGEAVWSRSGLPVMAAAVTQPDSEGLIELAEVRDSQRQTFLDVRTGETVEHPAVGVTVVITEPPPATLGSETFTVVGNQLVAVNQPTGDRRWAVDLDPTKSGRSAPIVVGDMVILAMSDSTPVCP
jgi:outer membrane protein assembly factor BamB